MGGDIGPKNTRNCVYVGNKLKTKRVGFTIRVKPLATISFFT